MASQLDIRLAVPGEAHLVHAITRAAFAEYAGFDEPSSALLETLDDVRSHLENGGGMIATLGERAVGAGRFAVDEEAEALSYARLAVLPAARGHGHGSAMIEWLEQHARSLGLKEVRTEARSQQPDNRPYYLARGYVITGYSGRYGIPDLSTHLSKRL